MSEVAVGTILLFASLAVLMLVRIPIAFSLSISALITATYLGIPYFNLFQKMSVSLISFTFIAVPFFIMMAQVMTDGEITKKLFDGKCSAFRHTLLPFYHGMTVKVFHFAVHFLHFCR